MTSTRITYIKTQVHVVLLGALESQSSRFPSQFPHFLVCSQEQVTLASLSLTSFPINRDSLSTLRDCHRIKLKRKMPS